MYVYVMLSKTNTKIGKVLRFLLRFKYNHISICLDEDYKRIYSFSRKYKNMPFAGEFVKEDVYNMFGEKKEMDVRIFKIPVTKIQYENLEKILKVMEKDVEGYIYNLAAVLIPIRVNIKAYKAYNCSQFIAKILDDCNIVELEKSYFHYTPKNFEELLSEFETRDYTLSKNNFKLKNEVFNREFSRVSTVKYNTKFILKLSKRIVLYRD